MKYVYHIVAALILLCSSTGHSESLHIAVAANFKAPMQKIAEVFEAQSEDTLIISYGSSGKLFAQIQHGAPYDVFLSADTDKPRQLVELNLADESLLFTYAIGQLVLVHSLGHDAKKQLTQNTFSRLAIANPRLAPYGLAGQSTLQSIGLWDQLQSKLVMGENIAQTFQFVHSGNAELGLVAASQIISNKRLLDSAWLVPSELHPPIAQDAALLYRSTKQAEARHFLEFLRSKPAIDIIKRFGYHTINADNEG